MKVLIIDDHAGLRESLIIALKNECSNFTFLQAGCCNDAKKILQKNKDLNILLLDLQVGSENGFSILNDLRKIRPEIRTLIYTAFYEPITIENALKKNIQGFITKTSSLKEISYALTAIASNKEYYCDEALTIMKNTMEKTENNSSNKDKTMLLFSLYKTLTPKEKDVFHLLALKFDITEIAEKLNKSIKTIENQRASIYAKMNIHDRLEAVEAGRILGVSDFYQF